MTGVVSRQVISRLHHVISEKLDPYIDESPFAILDFPDYANVGDSAIWLGEIAFFKNWGRSPSYVCERDDIDWQKLVHYVPNGPFYIHGGGNFGDLWPWHQDFRIELMQRFPGRLIIQFPQSIHFQNAENIAQTRMAIKDHGNFVLMVRDQPSYDFALKEFDCRTILCPDMAFCLGPQTRPVPAKYDELYLLRTDLERLDHGVQKDRPNALTADWLNEGRGLHPKMLLRTLLSRHSLNILSNPAKFKCEYFNFLADLRVRHGLKLLSSARHVTTDRLHAHILCTLLDIPHTVLDNNYGKIRRFMRAWETNWAGVTIAAAAASEA